MDDEPMWAADRVVALTLGSAITIPKTANEFAIKGNHLTLVKGNQFDGRTKTDPHKHIHEFLGICDMFKYRDTKNEAVRLMMFPLSLTGEAKTWLDELNEGTIETSLASNTQPNPRGNDSKAYQPTALSRIEHVNLYSEKCDEEDDEPTPQPKLKDPKLVKETPLPKPYKLKILYPQSLRKEKIEAQYGKFLDIIERPEMVAKQSSAPPQGLDEASPRVQLKWYKYNTNKVFQSASKAEDVFSVLLVLKLVLQLGSSVSLLVQEPCEVKPIIGLTSPNHAACLENFHS
ncbi:hypothetical protein Tco_0655005 [Tanacetum coccineum]|uniref:Reverse transcriptase domain-containing protein n=1 Tax=Tanacetum coccineum TaxID=301880 RepID=A0ABQ4X4T8_9ASTR